jgi:prepilin-type N-terminal cleavage/methylation domain-containing protein
MSRNRPATSRTKQRRGAFTLIELLVSISIIALLIAIIIPSFRSARRTAKNTTTLAAISTITQGLETFKQDNAKTNRRTNGYMSSEYREDQATLGVQKIYGAHWLVRALLGRDLNGYIPRGVVPANFPEGSANEERVRWYFPTPSDPKIDRPDAYVSAKSIKLVETKELPGAPPQSNTFFNGFNFGANSTGDTERLPVIVDSFGTPILYYAASSFPRSMCNQITGGGGGVDEKLTYNHQDNEGFTGRDNGALAGWAFKGRTGHDIAIPCPQSYGLIDEEPTFARYIHSEEIDQQSNGRTLRPVRPNSFLLISPGNDGRYGNEDDVKNF